jgi:hypothetical protein
VPDSLAIPAFPNMVFRPGKLDPPDPLEMFLAPCRALFEA